MKPRRRSILPRTAQPADRTKAIMASDTPERGELLNGLQLGDANSLNGDGGNADAPNGASETVQEPAKVMRIGSMIKGLLDEVRQMQLDAPSRERLAEIYERSIVELAEAISPDLREELQTLALPFKEGVVPSEAELREIGRAHV